MSDKSKKSISHVKGLNVKETDLDHTNNTLPPKVHKHTKQEIKDMELLSDETIIATSNAQGEETDNSPSESDLDVDANSDDSKAEFLDDGMDDAHISGVVVVNARSQESVHKTEVVRIENITKTYQMGDFELNVLKGVDLQIREGEFISIMGPSGSGKSTLMNILGLLDEPTSGGYFLDGSDVSQLSESQRAVLRNQKIGFVFQSFNLLKRTPAISQVSLPLIYGSKGKRSQLAKEALEAVGLGQRLDHTPAELSGGQQQRVAIARALVTQPSLILADEPTGNLDSKSGTEVMQIFQRLNREENKTTIFVTHDSWIARHTDRVIMLGDGKIIADQKIDQPLIAGESERPSAAGDLQGIFEATYYGGEANEYN